MRLLSSLYGTFVVLAHLQFNVCSGETPKGHLEPFGGWAAPQAALPEIQGFPSALEFYDNYVVPNKPVLMKGAAKGENS